MPDQTNQADKEIRITFDEIRDNCNKIITNSSNLMRQLQACTEPPFAGSAEEKRGFNMMVLNIGNALIAEEFARYIKGNPSDILIASAIPFNKIIT
jgi:hypothetical protein